MSTIRERVAEFDALTKAHPDQQHLCMGVTADRSALLAAGDALAEAVKCVFTDGWRCDQLTGVALCANHAALAAWKAVAG